jgi:hypothetical protein
VKRSIGVLLVASVALISAFAATSLMNSAWSTRPRMSPMSIPAPVQAALTIVESTRHAGPLNVESNIGSVNGGAWTPVTTGRGPDTTEHWSLRASDKSGVIGLGVLLSSSGLEAVSGWVPSSKHVTWWTFNMADPAATVHEVTVPVASNTIWSTSSTPQATSVTTWTHQSH